MGGSGRIGTKLVQKLRIHGHDVISASRSSGINTVTGEGLDKILTGAEAVIDVTNSRSFEDAMILNFFESSTRNILTSETTAKVKHHVILSVVGADRMPDSGYMRAKVAQENLVHTSARSFTIVRATQFFEFLGTIADASADQGTIHLPPVFIQPVAADDIAEVLAEVAVGTPMNHTVEFAGPERFHLDELIRQYFSGIQDLREVITDPSAKYFGAQLEKHALMPGDNSRIGATRFKQWLDLNNREL